MDKIMSFNPAHCPIGEYSLLMHGRSL